MHQQVRVYRGQSFSGLAGVGLFLLFATSHARANPLLAPPLPLRAPGVIGQLTLAASAQHLNVDRFGTYGLFGSPDNLGNVSGVELGAFGEPSAMLIVVAGAAPLQFTRGFATLIYEFGVLSSPDLGCSYPHYAIVGPDCSVPVRVDVFGRVETGGGKILASDRDPVFGVRATWALQNAQGFDIFSDGIIVGPTTDGSFRDQFGYIKPFSLIANRVYRLRMDVNAEVGASTVSAGSLALMDPVFSFGPGVDPGYSFEFSEGIGNSRASAVPEPGSLVLLGASMVAITFLRRRSTGRSERRPESGTPLSGTGSRPLEGISTRLSATPST